MSDVDYADYHDPVAGHHAAPDNGYGASNSPPLDDHDHAPHLPRIPNLGKSQPSAPLHHSYDPRDGRPIPPGYVPPQPPPPGAEPRYDPSYFPPPPRQEHHDDGYGPPPSDYDRGGYDRPPVGDYGNRPRRGSRGPNENQLTPYDDEKAEAEWRRGQDEDEQGRYDRRPPADYDRRDDRRYDSRDRRSDDRYYDYRPDSRDRGDDRRDNRPRGRGDSRYDEASSTSRSKRRPGPDVFGGREGQKGFGAQLLGGAAGGLIGHELGGGLIETFGGAVIGAIGAKVAEGQLEKRRSKKEAALVGAPYKDQAIQGRARSHGRSTRSPSRYDSRERDYTPSPPRRRASRSRRDDYSDEYSRSPPPRR